MEINKIVVVGLGYVGLPAALMWAKAGIKVHGVDINAGLVDQLNQGTLELEEEELNTLLADETVRANLSAATEPTEGDVFVVAVPTPIHHLKKSSDLSYVGKATESLVPYLRPGNLVIIESTIPPLTTDKYVRDIIERESSYRVPQDILLAHCPERILPGDIYREIVENDRIIGGVDERSTDAAAAAYKVFVKGNLNKTTALTAELGKLMENTYRDINIAIANEFSLICDNLGVDPREVIKFANKHPRVNILNPGIGVGGHCIPIDPWFLTEVAPYHSQLIATARRVNDSMPKHVASKIRQELRSISDPKIVALGATYKRNCADERESPAGDVVEELKRDGYQVSHYDPFVESMQYDSLKSIAEGADLLVVLVAHDVVRQEIEDQQKELSQVMRTPNILFLDK